MSDLKLPINYPVLSTPRLTIKELTLDDTEAVFQLFSDPEVTEHMDIEPAKSLEDAEKIISFHINDIGTRWGLFDKQTEKMLGTCGYHCWDQDEPSSIEIGYDLARAYWGKGLMSEALPPIIDFGFEAFGVSQIYGTIEIANERSIRVLERLGFTSRDELEDGLFYYYITKEQWKQLSS
jgi:ribosomal-protein-alanine N-acetyltransferase